MIIKLRLRNVQGISTDFEMRPITIVTGPNQVGKTTILEAVMLDMVGHVPRLGKLHKQTMDMASGEVMQVQSTHTNPAYSRNQVWGKKYSHVTEPADIPFTPVEMVSLADFFALSAADKTRYLLRRCGHNATIQEVWDKIVAQMSSLGFVESDLKPVLHLKETDKLCADWMEELTDKLKALLRDTRSELTGAQAATSEVTSQVAGGSLADTIQNFQAEIDAVTKERADIQKQAREATGAAAKAKADLDAIVKASNRPKDDIKRLQRDGPAQIQRIEDDAKAAPTCARCGGPVECPVCKNKATMTTVAVITKKQELADAIAKNEAEIETCRKNWVAQKKVSDTAEEERIRTESLDAPFVDKLADLGQKQARWHAEQGKKAAAERAKGKVEGLEAKQKLLKQFSVSANEIVTGILEGAIQETMAVANLLITPVLGITVDYKDGGFGYQAPKGRVKLATFSGTQETMLNLGISLALTMKAPEKIFLIDELSTFRNDLKIRILEVAERLIKEGIIHQIIMADPNVPTLVPDDTCILSLEK